MDFCIVVEEEGTERRVPLGAEPFTIGRGSDNTVVISDPRSSRHHCRVVRTPQGYLLEDLESRNGTFLSGTSIRKTLLQPGAQFLVGNVKFRLLSEAAGEPADASTAPEAPPDPTPAPPAELLETVASEPEVVPPPAAQVPAPRRGDGQPVRVTLERVVDGKPSGEKIRVESFPFVLGRGREAHLVLDDKRASGQHAQLSVEGGRVILEDLKSTNGTLVGNRPVTRCALPGGAVITVGNSVFRVSIAGGKPVPRGEAGGGSEDDELLRFDAERFLERDRSQQPLAVAALVAILAVIAYFTMDITRRLVERVDPDPRDEANLVLDNWSFEDAISSGAKPGAVSGWAAPQGDDVELALVSQGAQPPGHQALSLVSRGEGLVRASCDPGIGILGGKEYLLEGYALNQGAFAVGFLVEWFRSSTQGDVLVGRAFTDTSRLAGEAVDVTRRVQAPQTATLARVSCFVLGSGARGLFDRVVFRLAPEPGAAAPAAAAGGVAPEASIGRRTLTVGQGDEGLVVDLQDTGVYSLERRRRPIITELWPGLPSSSDPSLYGPRLAAIRLQGEGAAYAGELPDVEANAWLSVESRAAMSGQVVDFQWRHVALEGPAARSLWLYFTLRDSSVPIEAQAGETGVDLARVAPGSPALAGVTELTLGARDERIFLAFPRPVHVRVLARPGDSVQKVYSFEGGAEGVDFSLGPGSRRARTQARSAFEHAEALFASGKCGEAVAELSRLPEAFPEEKAELELAAERAAAWRKAAQEELRDLEKDLAAYRATPSPVLANLLRDRARKQGQRWAGTEAGNAAVAALAEVEKAAAEGEARGLQAELRSALELGRKSFAQDQLGLAELYLRWVAGAPGADEKLRNEAATTLRSIEGRRERDRKILLK